MLGKRSSDTKEKVINYVYDYAFANCDGLCLNKEKLDQDINIECFNLQKYLVEKHGILIPNNLIIQSIPTEENKSIIVKNYNSNYDNVPTLYLFDNNDEYKAKGFMAYLINDEMIKTLGECNKLDEYKKKKRDIFNFNDVSFVCNNQRFEIYNGGLFLEELLNNALSYKQLEKGINNVSI